MQIHLFNQQIKGSNNIKIKKGFPTELAFLRIYFLVKC